MSVVVGSGRWPGSLKKRARELERQGRVKTIYDISHKGERCVVDPGLLCRTFDCRRCDVYKLRGQERESQKRRSRRGA